MVKSSSKVIKKEVDLIKKIESDETWLEGERRNNYVDRNDPVVQNKVIEVCLREAEKIWKEAEELAKD